MTLLGSLVTIDPETLGGEPVFTGTRIPVKTLFDYLAEDQTLSAFLDDFPGVEREHAIAMLDHVLMAAFERSERRRPVAAE